MYTIIIKESFEASHYVLMPDGSLEPPHRHLWKLEVGVCSEKLDENGFAVEFLSLKKIIKNVLREIEGKDMNNIADFATNYPTAEIVSTYIYNNIKKHLPSGATLDYTILEEEEGCFVKYTDK
jgi:6-pyruvoyltetrahydropterin/6-carboxytetrahydropterin synthase